MNDEKINAGFLPVIMAGISALLFGMAAPLGKVLIAKMDPFLLAGLLYLGASAGLLPAVVSRHGFRFLLLLNRVNRLRLAGAVVFGGIAGPVLLMSGLKYASASSVSLWLNFELIATALLGHLFFRDYLGPRGWAGVFMALLSGGMLTVHEGASGVLSAFFVIAACLCWGLDNHFTALIDGISAVQSTFVKGLCAGSVNTVIGLSISGYNYSGGVMQALLLGSVSYGVSIVLYIMSAQRLGAIRSQIIFSGAPFTGAVFSVFFLHEHISVLQLCSFILLVISVAAMTLDRHEHMHEHTETEHTHYHRHDDMHHGHEHAQNVRSHEHMHRHEATVHAHPHWPDMHHRHEH